MYNKTNRSSKSIATRPSSNTITTTTATTTTIPRGGSRSRGVVSTTGNHPNLNNHNTSMTSTTTTRPSLLTGLSRLSLSASSANTATMNATGSPARSLTSHDESFVSQQQRQQQQQQQQVQVQQVQVQEIQEKQEEEAEDIFHDCSFVSTTTSNPTTSGGGGGVSSRPLIPARPRRLWKVNDTSLRPIPYFYPPLDPNCTVYISDAPPSVVAVRIAECLRKRSISVEYDEEAITATAMTIDRCHFTVHMYQGSSSSSRLSNAKKSNDSSGSGSSRGSHHFASHPRSNVDFSHGLLVECVRTRGNVITFHHTCRAILQAAQSHSTGEDDRKPYQVTSIEFQKRYPMDLISSSPPATTTTTTNTTTTSTSATDHHHTTSDQSISSSSSSSSSLSKALEALEHIINLCKKERLGPQRLAMEYLVSLTDPNISGMEIAIHCSLVVLGVPITNGLFGIDEQTLQQFHKDWIVTLLQHRVLPQETKKKSKTKTNNKDNHHHKKEPPSSPSRALNDSGVLSACASSLLGIGETSAKREQRLRDQEQQQQQYSSIDDSPCTNGTEYMDGEDEYHGGILRALSLRTFTNALQCIIASQSSSSSSSSSSSTPSVILQTILSKQSTHLVSKTFLMALLEDLTGASRPPMVVAGTRLASIHEATLAIQCLRLLGEHSDAAYQFILSDAVLSQIERLRWIGKSTHAVLSTEVEQLYYKLTEEVRSC